MKTSRLTHACTLIGLLTTLTCADAEQIPVANGFKLTNLRIDRQDIRSGGVPRDGIPSIDAPKFIPAKRASFMNDADTVISFTEGDVTRAYPLRILVWHEIVNETIAGRAILVTYCPLCGTAMVFDRKIDGKARSFGVSGLLYQSDVLMYDRENSSLWSQLKSEAISGPLSGTSLVWLPAKQLTWKAWKEQYPDGEVLSTDTGHRRDYDADAYADYFSSPKTMFPVPKHRDELKQKEWVVGIIAAGTPIAFPIKSLIEKREATLRTPAGEVQLRYNPASRLAQARGPDGAEIPAVTVFWFAWQSFHPKTMLWAP